MNEKQKKMAKCHPDREEYAKGACLRCYHTERYQNKSERAKLKYKPVLDAILSDIDAGCNSALIADKIRSGGYDIVK